MWTSTANEVQATLVASYVFFFYGLNVAFSADIENLIPNKVITVVEESFIGSTIIYATAFSSLSVGYLVNAIGRKKVILMSMLLNLTGWTIITFFLYNIETVYLGRVFCGMALGMRGASVIYITETSHKSRRGKLQALAGLIASIGVSVAYVIQYFFSSKVLAMLGFVISLVASMQTYFLYETKYYLLMKNDLKEAQNSILWFDQTMTLDEVHQEIEEIQAHQRGFERGTSIFRIFQQSSTVKSLIICLLIYTLRIGGSRVAITAYPRKFYGLFLLPVSVDNMTLIQGANEIIWSIVNVLVIDTRPRKFMLHMCCWTTITCLVLFCFQTTLVEKTGKFGQSIIFLVLIVYLGAVSGFLMDLTIICVSETASTNSEFRAIIFSIVQFGGSLQTAVYTNLYPLMLTNLSTKWIFIFMACSMAGLSLVVRYVPETRGRALHKCDWPDLKNKLNYLLVTTSESDISTSDEDS